MSGGSGGAYRPRMQLLLSDEEVNGNLRERLRDYNDRDTEAIQRHIRGLRDALRQTNSEVIETRYGGSVIRNTYVNGLSDVDVLLIVNDTSLSGRDPRSVIKKMAELIQRRMPKSNVTHGDMAVTIRYTDGHEVQVLPAIKTKSGVRVADPSRNRWSKVVRPANFAHKLTLTNQANRGQVVPAIKLTKTLIERQVQSKRDHISGYHLESLAIDAFRNYRGPFDHKSMVNHLCAYASKAVLQPIKDSTGQSRNVDDYMGPQGSANRQRAVRTFTTIRANLNSCRSESDVDNLFPF